MTLTNLQMRHDRSAPMARQLYGVLLRRACTFDLAPSQRQSEAPMSEKLGVNRTPALGESPYRDAATWYRSTARFGLSGPGPLDRATFNFGMGRQGQHDDPFRGRL